MYMKVEILVHNKNRKVEVYFGTTNARPLSTRPHRDFELSVNRIFHKVSDYLDLNGGTLLDTVGRFKGEYDIASKLMIFYCERSQESDLINYIESVFQQESPAGVKYVSVKMHDVDSSSFEIT